MWWLFWLLAGLCAGVYIADSPAVQLCANVVAFVRNSAVSKLRRAYARVRSIGHKGVKMRRPITPTLRFASRSTRSCAQ